MDDSPQKIITIKDGVDDESTWDTTELNIAAFLHYNGKNIISAKETNGKYIFVFNNPKSQKKCEELEIEFLNSEFIRYENSMRTIKKIIYSQLKHSVDSKEGLWDTPELNVAAYLHYKGKRIVHATREPSGKYIIMFSNPKMQNDKSCEEYEIEFLNSDFIRFDNSMKTIKKIVNSKRHHS